MRQEPRPVKRTKLRTALGSRAAQTCRSVKLTSRVESTTKREMPHFPVGRGGAARVSILVSLRLKIHEIIAKNDTLTLYA